ncbi:helix-turn-helix domain-containing protein [Nocardia salmonicida]|uniref:helix-turn-helix domain-containing protein n=1 Tax=Nocardia salmonicida TaxID=53431 RepID=UPI0033C094A7
MVINSEEDGTEPLSKLIARNGKRLREAAGLSLDEVARAAALYTRWTTSRVANIESGRSLPSLNQLLVYCLALNIAGAEDITLADLFEGDTAVRLTDSGPRVYASALHRIFAGGEVVFGFGDLPDAPGSPEELAEQLVETLRQAPVANFPDDRRLPPNTTDKEKVAALFFSRDGIGLADARAARNLGLSTDELTVWSNRLWRKTFSAERDARTGIGANAQSKGQTTRALLAEIRDALADSAEHPTT